MVAATAVSDLRGEYHFSAVPPGTCTVSFELAGFGRIVRTDVPVSVGFTAVVNARVRSSTRR
jgi:Carboxypeptidase regulatory-like domain